MAEPETKRARKEVTPSKVVHVRGLPDGASEADLAVILQPFGTISYYRVMPRLHQALAEFETIEAAVACVEYTKVRALSLGGRALSVAFSTSTEIHRPNREREDEQAGTPSAVLLYTIHNPLYPINVDVLHTITSPHGAVKKIAMTRKNGLQAFVEMESVDAATKVLQALHGQDIYAGSCTLNIQYSKADKVSVRVNGDESRDYTPAGLGLPRAAPGIPSLLATPPAMGGSFASGAMGGAAAMHKGSSVVMFHGMSPVLNCLRLFNLVSVFGNIVKIKFLAKKPGAALVQFVDSESAQLCIESLHNLVLFTSKIDAKFSKFPFISESDAAERLHDGTPCTVDYSSSPLNRFKGPMSQQMDKVLRPSASLHFYNAPLGTTEDILKALVMSRGASEPTRVTVFMKDGKAREKGLLFWPAAKDACEALCLCNNAELKTQDGQIYTLKLAFSSKSAQ